MNGLYGTIAEPLLTVIKSELSLQCIWPPDVIVKFEKSKKKVSKTVLVQSSLLVSFLASIRLGNKQTKKGKYCWCLDTLNSVSVIFHKMGCPFVFHFETLRYLWASPGSEDLEEYVYIHILRVLSEVWLLWPIICNYQYKTPTMLYYNFDGLLKPSVKFLLTKKRETWFLLRCQLL